MSPNISAYCVHLCSDINAIIAVSPRDLRIGNFRSNRISNRISGDIVVYMFNADCHVGVVYVL